MIHNDFITYIRTLQLWQLRLKDKNPHQHIYISQKIVKGRFGIDSTSIQFLIDDKEIEVKKQTTKKGHSINLYRALKRGPVNLGLLNTKNKEFAPLHRQMMNYLHDVSLPPESEATIYFKAFLEYRKYNIELFFIVDDFSKRVHTPITSFKSELRANILLRGEVTSSLDVATMQPLLLGKILENEIGPNEFSNWINDGKDIYTTLQTIAQLNNRDEGKKKFFEILFGKANNELSKMFNDANWIRWINEYKNRPDDRNPHTIEKQYSNLAWLLQSTEVNIMTEIWQIMANEGILFLSVHDEIIVRTKDLPKAKALFESVLKKYFSYFKLNEKIPFCEKSEKSEAENEQYISNEKIEAQSRTTHPTSATSEINVAPFNEPQHQPISWAQDVYDLITYFENITLPIGPIKLDEATTINAP
ncbi:MAG: hypothetical protein IPL09_15010 [Bacteroidetes bacterium]|nr:hypothetical protein [Bacteroidota bacterium]